MLTRLEKGTSNKLSAIVSFLLILAICVTSVVAYLTDADRARNTMTIGGSNITIDEGFLPPPELKPGVSFTKNVKVKNNGPSDCYVRIKAVFTTSDVEKYCEVDWNDAANGGDWIYNAEDNYWYYPLPIAKGDRTPSLFTKVSIKEVYDFDGNGTAEEDETIPMSVIQDFDIIVYAESYQSREFSGYENAYLDAWAHYQANKPD